VPELARGPALTVVWNRPSGARLALAARVYAGLALLFGLVYFGANWLASQREVTTSLQAEWERGIPFVPGAIAVYFSIALVFALPLFALDERGFIKMARAFVTCTCVAGAVFVALPLRLGFERPAAVAGFESIYAALYRFDAPFNTVPSLHVAYSTLILLTLARGTASRWGRHALTAWWLAICASVLLVHQHHVADVIGGILLGDACIRWLGFRRADRG
jgi:PAP2 superfamily